MCGWNLRYDLWSTTRRMWCGQPVHQWRHMFFQQWCGKLHMSRRQVKYNSWIMRDFSLSVSVRLITLLGIVWYWYPVVRLTSLATKQPHCCLSTSGTSLIHYDISDIYVPNTSFYTMVRAHYSASHDKYWYECERVFVGLDTLQNAIIWNKIDKIIRNKSD